MLRFLLSTLCNTRFIFHSLKVNLLFQLFFSCLYFLFFFFVIFSVAFQTFLLACSLALELKKISWIKLSYFAKKETIFVRDPLPFQLRVDKSVSFFLCCPTIRWEQTTRKPSNKWRGKKLKSCQHVHANNMSFLRKSKLDFRSRLLSASDLSN